MLRSVFILIMALLCGAYARGATTNSEPLLLKWDSDRLEKLVGRELYEPRVQRNSDGSMVLLFETAKTGSGTTIRVISTNGVANLIDAPSGECFLNEQNQLVAWREHQNKRGDYRFKNGTTLPYPHPGWRDIAPLISHTQGGKLYLKDGTVTDSRHYPTHKLSVDPSGRCCAYLVADTVSVYLIGEKTNCRVFVATNFWFKDARFGPSIFLQNGRIYLFGNNWDDSTRSLKYFVLSPQFPDRVVKEASIPGVKGIEDMDFASERIIAVKPHDVPFSDVYYLIDLNTGKRTTLGRRFFTALFLDPSLQKFIMRSK